MNNLDGMSFVVSVRNRNTIFQTVDSILSQDLDKSISREIVVVNYGGIKNIEKRLTAKGVTYIYSESKGIFSRSHALNIGIRQCKHELVCIGDADIIYDKKYFTFVWQHHRIRDREILIVPVFESRTKRMRNPKYCGPGISVRKKWIYEVNGYDEELFGHSQEDVDIFARLTKRGPKITYSRLNPSHIKNVHLTHSRTISAPRRNKNYHISVTNSHKGVYKVNVGRRQWGVVHDLPHKEIPF